MRAQRQDLQQTLQRSFIQSKLLLFFISISTNQSLLQRNHDASTIHNMCQHISYVCQGIRRPKPDRERNRRCGNIVRQEVQRCSEARRRKNKRPCDATPGNTEEVRNRLCAKCYEKVTGGNDSGNESTGSSSSGFSTSSNGSSSLATWVRVPVNRQ